MDSQERLRLLVQRTWQLTVFLGLAFTAILVGYWYTQIVRGAYYRELAENNRLRELKIEAPRGVILDREGRALVENVPSYFLLFDRGRSANVESSLSFVSRTLDLDIVKFGRQRVDTPTLIVPHPELPRREFWRRELALLEGAS